jgi:hypothetical protein
VVRQSILTYSLRLCIAALLSACGASETPPPKAPELAPVASVKAAKGEEPVPSRCVFRKGACMPPTKWAERLCTNGVYQDLALYMFQDGTPWTRFYMKLGLNAVNGWGPTIGEDMLQGEEVLVLNYRRNTDSFSVEGSMGTYDVLRWNGSCVTLDVNEVTNSRPRNPRYSRIDWRSLSEEMQSALLKEPFVEQTYEERRKACKGASIGLVSAKCEQLDHKLVEKIVTHTRGQRTLPKPKSHP